MARRAFIEVVFEVLMVIVIVIKLCSTKVLENPKFSRPISNYTVAVGREAILACVVENLSTYKVAWLKVDTQTILTIHTHVITKNRRIGVTHSEHKTWYLHIREVRESDKGLYMCQINTDPMKSQVGYLDVVVPPDILDFPTSADMILDEGSNVTLKCVAKGSPKPTITWKREGGQYIPLPSGSGVSSISGSIINITKIKREDMGPYLCIASNGVPPSVSKRITVIVQFPPFISIRYQLVSAYDNQQITLECDSEAYPKAINYWTRNNGEIIPHSAKYVPEIIEFSIYKVHMKLTLVITESTDYGIYKCISKNSLGEMEGTINVYQIPRNGSRSFNSKSKSSIKQLNDVTYQIDSREKDRADLLFLEDKYYSGAHQIVISKLLVVVWLRVLSYYIL